MISPSRPYKLAYQVGPPTSGPASTFIRDYSESGLQDIIKEEIKEKGFFGYLSDSIQRFVGLKPTLTDEDVKEMTKQIAEATSGNLTGGSSAGLSPDDPRAKYGLIPYLLLPTYVQAQQQNSKILNAPKPGSTVKTSNVYQCPYSGCTGFNKGQTCFNCRCQKLCTYGVKSLQADGTCHCKPKPTSTSSSSSTPIAKPTTGSCKCSYPGCSGISAGSPGTCKYCCDQRKTYYLNRCKSNCKGYSGGYTMKTDGSCSCRGSKTSSSSTTTSKPPVQSAKGCPYTGCINVGTAGSQTCFRCRCNYICRSRGGIKSLLSNGTCHCNR